MAYDERSKRRLSETVRGWENRRFPSHESSLARVREQDNSDVIRVRNDTGIDLELGEFVGIGDAIYHPTGGQTAIADPEDVENFGDTVTPADEEERAAYKTERFYAGELYDYDVHLGRFAVLLSDLPQDEVGLARVSGTVIVRVLAPAIEPGGESDKETDANAFITVGPVRKVAASTNALTRRRLAFNWPGGVVKEYKLYTDEELENLSDYPTSTLHALVTLGADPGDYCYPVFNTTEEEIPPFAVMEVIAYYEDDRLFDVRKPTDNPKKVVYLFNSRSPIPAGGYGRAAFGDTVTIRVNEGEDFEDLESLWGPVDGEWGFSVQENGAWMQANCGDDTLAHAPGGPADQEDDALHFRRLTTPDMLRLYDGFAGIPLDGAKVLTANGEDPTLMKWSNVALALKSVAGYAEGYVLAVRSDAPIWEPLTTTLQYLPGFTEGRILQIVSGVPTWVDP